jgi:hypothetical protein
MIREDYTITPSVWLETVEIEESAIANNCLDKGSILGWTFTVGEAIERKKSHCMRHLAEAKSKVNYFTAMKEEIERIENEQTAKQ